MCNSFVKFACGAYGKFNTKIIYNINNNKKDDEKLIRRLHPNDYSFSLHTKIPLKCILSSSYHYSNSKNESLDAPKLDYVIAVDHLTNSGNFIIIIITVIKKYRFNNFNHIIMLNNINIFVQYFTNYYSGFNSLWYYWNIRFTNKSKLWL